MVISQHGDISKRSTFPQKHGRKLRNCLTWNWKATPVWKDIFTATNSLCVTSDADSSCEFTSTSVEEDDIGLSPGNLLKSGRRFVRATLDIHPAILALCSISSTYLASTLCPIEPTRRPSLDTWNIVIVISIVTIVAWLITILQRRSAHNNYYVIGHRSYFSK